MEHFSFWERRIDFRRKKGSMPQNELPILSVLQKICYGHDLISMLIYRLCNCFILHTACMSPFFKTPRYWLRGVRHMHHQKLHSVNPCPVSSCWSMLWILHSLHFFPSSGPHLPSDALPAHYHLCQKWEERMWNSNESKMAFKIYFECKERKLKMLGIIKPGLF